jgi:hypothetical protein
LGFREVNPEVFCNKKHENGQIQETNVTKKRTKKGVFVYFVVLQGIGGSPCAYNQTNNINQKENVIHLISLIFLYGTTQIQVIPRIKQQSAECKKSHICCFSIIFIHHGLE